MAQFIKLYNENPNEKEIAKIVEVLRNGGLIIYPTDTVYGLGCDITNTKALEKIARIKGVKLEKANFSFVCSNLPKDFKKKKTVGIRVPDNLIARTIVERLGNPIVSTSIYDEDDVIEYTTDPELIFEKWQNLVDIVIDGGYGDNTASTVIDLSGDEPVVIREGKGDVSII